MIPELEVAIDAEIEKLKPIEENPWRIYGACKRIIIDYEHFILKKWFSSDDYDKYIKYITGVLQI